MHGRVFKIANTARYFFFVISPSRIAEKEFAIAFDALLKSQRKAAVIFLCDLLFSFQCVCEQICNKRLRKLLGSGRLERNLALRAL